MKTSVTQNQKGKSAQYQARAEQQFSTASGHGDFCLTAYGATQQEAQANLRKLALQMVRALESERGT